MLADFMANIVEASLEDKLQVLSLLDVKERVNKVIELLDRQVGSIKNSVKITTFSTTALPFTIDPDSAKKEIEKIWKRPGAGRTTLKPGQS